MYVGLKMLKRKDFVTVTPETLVAEAEKLLLKNRLWMLLVEEDGHLVGCVTKEAVKEALPSRVTSLSKHEINYLLCKLKVREIYSPEVPSVRPETEIEEAARLMYDNDWPGLAVTDQKRHLLGYINRSVMLQVLVEEMGLLQGGSRIVFEVEERRGVIHEVSGIISGMSISIISTATFYHDSRRMVVLRVATPDPGEIIKALEGRGYAMVGPETFAAEWS